MSIEWCRMINTRTQQCREWVNIVIVPEKIHHMKNDQNLASPNSALEHSSDGYLQFHHHNRHRVAY